MDILHGFAVAPGGDRPDRMAAPAQAPEQVVHHGFHAAHGGRKIPGEQ